MPDEKMPDENMSDEMKTPAEPTILSSCERCGQELGAALLGITDAGTQRFVRLHLADCPACRLLAAEMQASLDGLLHVTPVPVSAGTRSALLERACQTPLEVGPEWLGQAAPISPLKAQMNTVQPLPRPGPGVSTPPARVRPAHTRWGAWAASGLGLAAALLLVAPRLNPGVDTRQVDVVISAGTSLVMARSEHSQYSLVIRTPAGRLRGVRLDQARPAWYTEGVYSAGRAYLLDAANERLVVLNVAQGRVERTYPAPGGAAGLAVTSEGIFVKSSASGELRLFRGESCVVTSIGKPANMPQAEYMDAVLPLPGRVLTTQHSSGQVIALSADGRRVLARYQVGGAPVGLLSWRGRTLVLDVQGRLLELGAGGQVTRTLGVPGHPDKFSLMGDHAYLTDRGGSVSEVDLLRFSVVQQRTFGKPMDIVALPGGHLALADATRGLLMLDSDLNEL